MPRHLISDTYEWINEIHTVHMYYLIQIVPTGCCPCHVLVVIKLSLYAILVGTIQTPSNVVTGCLRTDQDIISIDDFHLTFSSHLKKKTRCHHSAEYPCEV